MTAVKTEFELNELAELAGHNAVDAVVRLCYQIAAPSDRYYVMMAALSMMFGGAVAMHRFLNDNQDYSAASAAVFAQIKLINDEFAKTNPQLFAPPELPKSPD